MLSLDACLCGTVIFSSVELWISTLEIEDGALMEFFVTCIYQVSYPCIVSVLLTVYKYTLLYSRLCRLRIPGCDLYVVIKYYIESLPILFNDMDPLTNAISIYTFISLHFY
jgi:hypothetical protein